jgi:Spy/CpxP family protein refolding chaperone
MIKSWFSTVLLCLVLVGPALAEPHPYATPQPAIRQGRNNRSLVPMGKHLGLTNDQMKRLRIAMKSYPPGPDREDAIKRIMTPEQRAKYQAFLDKKRHAK